MFNHRNAIVLFLTGGLALTLNAGSMKSETVYVKMCSVCHGVQAQGNPSIPDAPALNKLSKEELATKLSDIKGKGFDNAHAKMEKNQKIIELRGMKYNSNDMAEYIYSRFNTQK